MKERAGGIKLPITDALYGRDHPAKQAQRPPRASRGHARKIRDCIPPETLERLSEPQSLSEAA